MEPDPLREIRNIRQQIANECGNDSERVFAYYVNHQEQMKTLGKYKFVTQVNRSNSLETFSKINVLPQPPVNFSQESSGS